MMDSWFGAAVAAAGSASAPTTASAAAQARRRRLVVIEEPQRRAAPRVALSAGGARACGAQSRLDPASRKVTGVPADPRPDAAAPAVYATARGGLRARLGSAAARGRARAATTSSSAPPA